MISIPREVARFQRDCVLGSQSDMQNVIFLGDDKPDYVPDRTPREGIRAHEVGYTMRVITPDDDASMDGSKRGGTIAAI